MTRSSLSLCKRIFASVPSASIVLLLLILSGLANYQPAAALQAPASGPKIWLQENQSLGVHHTGPAAAGVAASQPVSMASGDVDGDGVPDLVVGHKSANGGFISIYRGNLDAFAPQSDASLQAIGQEQFPSPFQGEASTFAVPVNPDFIALGNFTGNGQRDLAVAALGGNAVYVFAGDGAGGFGAPQTVILPGGITAMGAGDFGASKIFDTLLVGIKGTGKSGSLIVLGSSEDGVKLAGSFPVSAAVSDIQFAHFNGATGDAAFLAGGQIFILRSATMQVAPVSLPIQVRAFALGSFIFDRTGGTQIAVLTPNGSVEIAARSEFDPRTFSVDEFSSLRQAKVLRQQSPLGALNTFPTTWKIVDTFPSVGTLAAGQTPVFFRTRVSSNGGDDIMWLNAGNGQMAVISHPDTDAGAQTFVPGTISIKPYNGSAVKALPLRVNIDGRPGIVALHQGEVVPSVSMPIPDPTFFVNRTDDPTPTSPITNACNNVSNTDLSSSCSLREAVLKANAPPTGTTDTIQLAAHTYTLTIGRVGTTVPVYDANHGTLNINDSVNIVGTVDGSGNPTSIITWGTLTSGVSVDMIMAVNEDINPLTNATASISNVIMQNGVNHGQHGNDGDGGCMEFDTGTSGNANLTLTNVVLDTCSTTQGNGAGIAIFNFTAPNAGLATFTNSTIQNSSAVDSTANVGAGGGGIWVSQDSRAALTNTKILNNKATQVNGTGKGIGGGIFTFTNTPNSRQTVIHGSTISGNKSAGFGGGIWNSVNLQVDTSTVISNNTAGTDGTNPVAGQNGGGLYDNTTSNGCPGACTDVATLSKVTITGNTASGSGGGIYHGNNTGSGSLTMSFSRLAGNSATTSGTNFFEDHSVATITDNWWGTNAAATTITNSGGTPTFDPFIVLTHHASLEKIKINASSTLTGDMSADNHGTAVGLPNLTEIIGLPITFAPGTPVLGSIPQAQPETVNASAQATATFNAGGTSGRANPTATVDQGTALANDSLISSATEAATTATITTVGAHGFATGETVVISGVGVVNYNGTFIITATPTVNTFTYTAGTAGLGASSGGTANVGLVILEPPQIAKSFGAASIPVNGTTTLSFSINNPNVVAINEGFTDTLPTGLQVAAIPGVTNTCGGTVTATAGSGSISFSNNLTPVGVCVVTVNITGTVDNLYTNSVQILSTDAGNGNTSSANLTVINPPTIAKAFGAATIPLNGTTSLTFTVSSTNQNLTLNGVAFTDSLPAGLVVATPNNLNTTCSGTATAVAGSSSVSLSGASLAPGASCTVSVNVTGTAAGVLLNSVQATSTNGGSGNTSNASITVVAPPTISKAFSPTSIALNDSSTLSFTITNPNTASALSGVAFTDNLPSGVVVSTVPNVTGSCGSGTITAVAGSGSISLSGGTLTASPAAGSSCTFSVSVTGTSAGAKSNTTGNVTSTEGGTGAPSNTAVLTVVAPPSIAKVFNPTTIPLNGTTTLTFTITNPAANTAAEAGVAFTDTLPTGLVVSTPNGLSNTCGGTATAVAGSTSISLTGGSIAVNTNCTVVVNVTGNASGQYTNTSGAVSSTNGGTGNTASANLTVASPPSINKAFGATTIPLNGTTSLTFTIQNPNTNVALTGVAFTDNLPAGLVVATPNGLNNTCGGTTTAVEGSGSVSLAAGTVAASGSCTVSVNVQGTVAGPKTNSVSVTSTEGGTGNTSTASITVVAPPVIIKAFGAASIPLNGSTSLSFTINNPNTTTALTGVGFSDTLPAGLIISTPNGQTGSCGVGGTITATAGTNVISLSGGSIAASGSCTFSINVTGTAAGLQNNTTGNVTSTEGGTGGTASTSIKVEAPPSIAKIFAPSTIAQGGTTSLTFTITNPAANVDPLNGVTFTDTLPTGLTVANSSATVCGGTLTTTAPTGITLSGATIAANSQCQFSVTVTGVAAGSYTNTTGNVTSTNGGTGNTASANLTVQVELPPSIAKVFNPSNIALNATTSLTFTITNPAANIAALTGVAFTDTLPTGLTVANATSTVCGGTLTTTNPTGIALTGATVAVGGTCQFSVTVTGAAAGQFTNTTGNVTSTNGGTGNTASANLTVATPPTITKAFGASSILVGANTSLTFNISNPNASLALTGIAFSDTLPAGLVVATPSGLTNTGCGGTATAAAGSGSISLTGGSLAANASCTITLNVTGVQAGVENNTTGPISSNESGAGATSNTATITVIGPPSIAKAFGAASIQLNATTTLTFTITNPNATVALTGVGFGDTLPAGLAVANPNGLTGSCGAGTITTGTVSGFSVVNLSGGTIAAGGSCTFSVNVVGQSGGHKVNTTGIVTSNEGGSGNKATATIDVEAPDLAITKTHSGTFTRGQTGAVWTIGVSNVGFGPTVGTVTVVDTLPNVQNPPVPTDMSGTGWTCTLATLTCTRADALPSGSSYPPITLTVNIPKNIQNNFTNKAVVSGGGDVNPTNNTATDSVSLGPPIIMTPQSSSVSVVHGGTANMVINVDAPDPTLGVITFTCSGLPSASTCNFSPGSIDPATTPGPTAMTVSVFTTHGTASLSAPLRPGAVGRNPLYAMFAFPVFGMILAGFGGQRRKGIKRLPLLIMLGLVLLLAMAGCGVAPPAPPPVPGTPAGTFAVTVTATSTGFTATTSFNLIVQ